MGRYLREAFLLRVDVPGLGRMPVNLLAVTAVAALGIPFPWLWLLGLGLETGYLAFLSQHPTFRRWVELRDAPDALQLAEARRKGLLDQLPLASRERMVALEAKVERILAIYADGDDSDGLLESYRQTLAKPQRMFLQLLHFEEKVRTLSESNRSQVNKQIQSLERDLEQPRLPSSVRDSKQATLQILHKRRNNLDRRTQLVQEIGSDLTRIEAEMELALENAILHDRPKTITSEMDIASHLLEELGDLFDYRFEDDEQLEVAFQQPRIPPPPRG